MFYVVVNWWWFLVNKTGERVLQLLKVYQPELFEKENDDEVIGA